MKIGFIFICSLLLCSCEKNINFNLNETPNVLVVDASIENGKPPIVILSKSFDYFSNISPEILDSSFVHNADITISNGFQTSKLKEYIIDSIPGYKFFYYSIDPVDLSNAITGDFNTTYHLKIKAEGAEYTSTTTIPLLIKKPDSLWWKPVPDDPENKEVIVMARSTDPPGLGNYIRYFTQINSQPFLAGENSVFDDQFIDGTTYDIPVVPGIDRNNKIKMDDNYFKRGDTVTLKLCNIDRTTFKFWQTMEFAYQSIGNPFASTNKVIGNISNNALGAFCGYAAAYKTIVIPK